jgi:hypothetical protein
MNPSTKVVFASIVLAFMGCAAKRLPPGTPPPEYEKRTFEPWPPLESDAGADAAAPAVEPAGPPPTEAAPPTTNDAGPPGMP